MGRGPKPFAQTRVSTTFVRVPSVDWPAVKRGYKTEFRTGVSGNATQAWGLHTPTPVVAYAVSKARGHDARLMVLEQTWREPLGAITPESLAREGFPDMAHFRRYMMGRTRRHFTPTRTVQVFRVRPWLPSDAEKFATAIFDRLYGEWVDGAG